MKRLIIFLILAISGLALAVTRYDVLENDPFPITHWFSAEEAENCDLKCREFFETDPPPAPVHNVAEFEKMQGVLIRYPFGVPMSLIAAMSQQLTVITIVDSQSHWGVVEAQYINGGVNMSNAEYLIAPSDTYWTRDYAPWYVIDGEGDFGATNFPYNRPRPNDDDIPIEIADYLDDNLWGMNMVHNGGNYMTDGMGISASTTLVYNENSISNDEINQMMLEYLGIQTYHLIDDPNNNAIFHINCWGKFLDVDKVMIRQVPESHPQFNEIEEVADYFSEQTSSYGNYYHVFRVYTPNDQPYINALILNDHVYVPITGGTYDDDAIASYQTAMPGYTIMGINAEAQIWEPTDALHCRTKGIADHNMLYIYHMPLLDDQPADVDMEISAGITAYSGADVISEEVFLHYKIGNGNWIEELMLSSDMFNWVATIPGQPTGTVVAYYITACDADDNFGSHPFIGQADPHVYFAGGELEPEMYVYPQEFVIEMISDTILTETLELTNIGGGIINYTLEFMDTSRNIAGSYVECENELFYPGENLNLGFSVYNGGDDNEWLQSVAIDFPEGFDVTGASNFWGGIGGMMYYEGAQGNGALVTWFGETSNGWGVVHNGETAVASVYAEVAPDFTGNAVLNWTICGDGFANDPHTVSGSIELGVYVEPVEWIFADQLDGDLGSQETDEIALTFDTTGMEDGDYSCNIVVTSDGEEVIIPVSLTIQTTPQMDDEIISSDIELTAYPNPFNPQTCIFFEVVEAGRVKIDVYNVKGQKIETLVNDNYQPGKHNVTWKADGKASGLYFLRYQSAKTVKQEKVLLLK